jgi:PAS domain S-box-containing protein
METREDVTIRKILIVEHDSSDAELYRRVLQRANGQFQIDMAASKEDYLARIRQSNYDVVLSDYRMPGWSGLEALAMLRSEGKDTPLLLVTSTLGDEVAVECMKKGVADYVLKDRLARLPMAIERAIGEEHLREDRTRAENLQHLSESGLQFLFASHPLPMYVYDLETFQFLQVNDAAVTFYGFTREEFSYLKAFNLRADDASFGPLRESHADAAAEWFSGEFRHRKKSGSVVDVHIVRHLINYEGRKAGLSVVQDITARKRGELEIVSRARQQSALAGLSQQALEGLELGKIFDEAAQMVALVLSVDFVDIMEWRPSENSLDLRAAMPAADAPVRISDGRNSHSGYTLLCGGPIILEDLRIETRFRSARLTARKVVSGLGIVIPGPDHAFGVLGAYSKTWRRFFSHELQFLQATAHLLATALQKRASEEALRHSETRYRELFENATYGIYRASIGGKFLQLNAALVRILKYSSKQELMDQPANAVYRNPGDADRLIEEYCQFGCVHGVEVEWTCKDGSFTTVRLSGRAVLDEGGNPEGLEIIVEDVAQRRALERQLRLAQKFEAIGQLAGGIAHDFNNVIGAIMGWAELGAEQATGESRLQSYFAKIGEQSTRAASLTRQLLAFARRQILEPQTIDVNHVVTEVLSLLEKVIGGNIEIETRLGCGLAAVRADPTQLEQVLLNLCVNARDAMPQGGRLTIETREVKIGEDSSRSVPGLAIGHYIELSVSDNGIGMDAATRDRIFEPFFTTKEPGRGTGLGLATVFGIVKQHDGHIHVESAPAEGASFRVLLPAACTAGSLAVSAQAEPEVLRGGTETLLLAEDHEGLREIARVALERRGYRVLIASDGSEAVAVFREHQAEIALAVVDLVMPHMGGLAAAEALRELQPNLRLIFTTGYTSESAALVNAVARGEVVLNKPYEPAVLARKVRELLDRVVSEPKGTPIAVRPPEPLKRPQRA